ncbi:MAG: two-component system sensor histidine kinase NtrB [Planctomycetales bacterium]
MTASDRPDRLAEPDAGRLEALAEFAAGAGHEINNPVATIVGYVQQLLAGESDPDRRQALLTIGGQAYRIRDMIGDVMLFARPPKPQPERQDLGAVCREVLDKFAAEAVAASCRLELDAPLPVPVLVDPVQLRVAISALVRNSLEAVGTSGEICLRTERAHAPQGQWGILHVRDNGVGLSESDRKHLFDPFYSGRQAGRGLGFGLPKTWRIVTLHGGRIEVDAPSSGGVAFTIYWPTDDANSP